MTLALDILGSRYGLLPSEVLVRASTVDLFVVDVAMTYENHRQKQESGDLTSMYSQEQLESLVKNTRGGSHG